MADKLDNENVYVMNGYEDRNDYLNNLADNFGIDRETVKMIADVLGPSEDFDGLINELDYFVLRNQ